MMRSGATIETEIVRAALGNCPRPPVDLRDVASAIGVGRVVFKDIWNGSTDFGYMRPIIYLSRSDSDIKRRVVFAHELAHVMLRMPRVVSLIESQGHVRLLADEEQLADRIAATLLIPDGLLEVANGFRARALKLAEVAKCAEVSLAALIRRMSAAGVDAAMLHWEKGHSNWHVTDRPGVPLSLQGTVKPSLMGYWAIENVGDEEGDVVVDCRINGWPASIAGSSFREGSSVMQVIQPSSAAVASSYSEYAGISYRSVTARYVS